MCDQKLSLSVRHSYYMQESLKHSSRLNNYKSEINLTSGSNDGNGASSSRPYLNSDISSSNNTHGEYYKRYEHDEIPVKDSNDTNFFREDKISITNSELEKLEQNVLRNVSSEFQPKENSKTSLESNIKFFKTTVQEIFDNFYNSMRDYEQYKKRFQEILAKSQEESVAEMEDFIKDMIQHIMSSDTSVANTSETGQLLELKDKETNVSHVSDSTYTQSTNERVVEAYKNDNYLTDSTLDDLKSKRVDTEEIFNIYLLGGAPCLEIKMNARNMLSEIKIKERKRFENQATSAENLKKLAAKRLELEKYLKRQLDNQIPDREIPMKRSFAKKNIHLNEDFDSNECGDTKSFMAKICNFLCRKLRKNSFA